MDLIHHPLAPKVATFAAAIAIVGLIAWGLAMEGDSTPEVPFKETGPQYYDTLGAAAAPYDSLLMDPVANLSASDTAFLDDSTYLPTHAQSMAEMQRLRQAERDFRRQFTIVARAVLERVYTSELLHGDRQTFITRSTEAMSQLINLAMSMQQQYQIDPTTAEAIAGDVIATVTDDLKQNAAETPREGK